MKKFSLIIVLNKEEDHVLMCYRKNNPYKGLYNFVGGKVEENEDYLVSAYRELEEETAITDKDIKLVPFIDFTWHPADMEMKVFIGKLYNDVELVDEIHPLSWISIKENFFDMNKFAGEGNIGHMIEIFNQLRNDINI